MTWLKSAEVRDERCSLVPKLRDQGLSINQIAGQVCLSPSSIFRILRESKDTKTSLPAAQVELK